MSTAPRPQDDPQQAVNAYFNGLAAKDVSRIPWADNATLRTPLNPAGGESELIRGRKAILDFFAGVLPALRSVKVVRHYASEEGWVAAQAEIGLTNGQTLYALDAFHIQRGEIIEQQNHYDSRSAATKAPAAAVRDRTKSRGGVTGRNKSRWTQSEFTIAVV